VPYDTVPVPSGPWAAPGRYTVKLTVNGKSYSQPLTLKMDPRVKTPALGLMQQFTLSRQLYDGQLDVQQALVQLRDLRAQVQDRRARGAAAVDGALAAFDRNAAAIEGNPGGGFGGGRGGTAEGPETLNSINAGLGQLMGLIQGADVTPTTQIVAAVTGRRQALARVMSHWNSLRGAELTALNATLKDAKLTAISVSTIHQ
jgi:hypothetical protein